MRVTDLFQRFEQVYPISDYRMNGNALIDSIVSANNKVSLVHELTESLHLELISRVGSEYDEDMGYFIISPNFAPEPYFDKEQFKIKYKDVLFIFFAVMFPNFHKDGFFSEWMAKYYQDGKQEIKVLNYSKKKNKKLTEASVIIQTLISDFLTGNLELQIFSG